MLHNVRWVKIKQCVKKKKRVLIVTYFKYFDFILIVFVHTDFFKGHLFDLFYKM